MFSNVEPIISVIIVPTGSSVDLRKYTRTDEMTKIFHFLHCPI